MAKQQDGPLWGTTRLICCGWVGGLEVKDDLSPVEWAMLVPACIALFTAICCCSLITFAGMGILSKFVHVATTAKRQDADASFSVKAIMRR